MKKHVVWVLRNKHGAIWKYTNGLPFILRTKKEASSQAATLHGPSEWKPFKASLVAY